MEDKVDKNTQEDQQKEKKMFLNEESLRNIWDNMKYNNIHIMGIPEEESEQRINNLFEKLMTKNFLNMVKEKDTKFRKFSESQIVWTQRGLH